MDAVSLRSFLISVSLLVAVGCAASEGASALYTEAAREDPRGRPYVIGVADVVRVSVWKDPNLSTDAVVRPDGTITLPLVGEILSGTSPEQDIVILPGDALRVP